MSSLCPRHKPSRDLRGKVAIVTGAGSRGTDIGNGRATSILLAEDGASVICVDKDLALAQQTVSMIKDMNRARDEASGVAETGQAVALEADVTLEQDCKRIVDTAMSSLHGRLDILVNVVGIIGAKGTAVTTDAEAWAQGLQINVTSMMLMAKYAVPAMLQNERTEENQGRGSIVNIGSVAGLRGGTPHLLYPTSKGAVVNMTRAMAAHHGPEGIRVNCVCPGMLFTPMMSSGMNAEMREARKSRSLLKTEGNAWDCASAIRFLAGDEARWITGAILTVDAGATAAVALAS
ncbi:putative tropinone reductase [Lasiosphaeria hispida]|uniref:Tropinone reductase n=1 Tax=Lasiosphaeria hispida TaxID=260671 RepID=A0AAJ0HFF6_9PEZI|nr:putative tropinone reductase [Lasiosphaeria hispida]